MVGTDGLPVPQTGLPQGPHPPVHILPCPYYTRPWRADSSYRRGERGEDAVGWALVVARPVSCPSVPATTSLLLFMLSYNNTGIRSYTIGDK